ncbi:MAG TPA: hypothetical protein VGI56_09985 [Galbitalea sp.]
MAYAQGTEVTVDRSQTELRSTLRKYGADGLAMAETRDRAVVEFMANDRRIRFSLPLPTETDADLRRTKAGVTRSSAQLRSAVAAEERRRWRALVMVVKAKLEAVESGIVTFEDEFLAQTVLPDNSTVAEQIQEPIRRAYIEGHVRPLLELGS